MARDLHDKPFQEHTLNKLQLFFDHTLAWLSVLVRAHDQKKNMPKKLRIYDFFCGPGRDEHGQDGSPLLVMRTLNEFRQDIKQRHLDVGVVFNDVDSEKVGHLQQILQKEGYTNGPWKIDFRKESFDHVFAETYPSMRGQGNLILLDQHGIKFFTPELFNRLRNLSWTDTLIFMSSSCAYRFRETPEIQQYLDAENIFPSKTNYYYIHRAITQYFRKLIPTDSEYYLIPYSFKSGGNIYGLIFACGNALGAQKFLEAAWRRDKLTGEANYLIDSDQIDPRQKSLFSEMDKPKKINLFERSLEKELIEGKLSTTSALYRYALREGFLPKHVRPVFDRLCKEGYLEGNITGLGYKSIKDPRPIKRTGKSKQ